MKCPYCAEDIKDEAIVCRHCHRDLTFLKPLERKIDELRSEVASLSDCVGKMAAFLDRQQIEEKVGGDSDQSKKKKKPGVGFVAFSAVVLLVLLSLAITGLEKADSGSRPKSVFDEKGNVIVSQQKMQQEYDQRSNQLGKLFVAAVFALPVGLGVWIGLRWPGRNLKSYLFTGFAAWLPDAFFFALLIVVLALYPTRPPGIISFVLIIMTIDLFRCMFGFTAGGLLGDWIERKRYPQLYGRGFSDLMALKLANRRENLGWFGRATHGLGSLTTSFAPLVPLMGVIITSVIGYYATQNKIADDRAKAAAAEKAKAVAEEKNKQSVSKPADTAPAQSPQPSQ